MLVLSPRFEALPAKVRYAMMWIFVYEGILLGAWAGAIPQIKTDRQIDNGVLGRILTAAIVGAILAVPVAAKATDLYGANVTLLSGCIAAVLFTPILGIPPYHQQHVFVFAVVLLGFVLGILDIAANFHVTLIEKKNRDKYMGFFYSVYSAGCLLGALCSGVLQQLRLSVLQIFLATSLACILPCLYAYPGLYTLREQQDILQTFPDAVHSEDGPMDLMGLGYTRYHGLELDESVHKTATDYSHSPLPLPTPTLQSPSAPVRKDYPLLGALMCIGFLAFLCEGSISDWSGIYLRSISNASPSGSTGGYILYQFIVMVSRYQSDRLASLGVKTLLVVCAVVSCLGFLIIASACLFSRAASYYVALLGFAVVGAGLGAVAPIVVAAASKIEGMKSSDTVALLSAVSYTGILVGPPLLGYISVICRGLEYSLVVEGALVALIVPLAYVFIK